MLIFQNEMVMTEAIQFTTGLSVVVLFTCMLFGLSIKKLIQLML